MHFSFYQATPQTHPSALQFNGKRILQHPLFQTSNLATLDQQTQRLASAIKKLMQESEIIQALNQIKDGRLVVSLHHKKSFFEDPQFELCFEDPLGSAVATVEVINTQHFKGTERAALKARILNRIAEAPQKATSKPA